MVRHKALNLVYAGSSPAIRVHEGLVVIGKTSVSKTEVIGSSPIPFVHAR